MILGTQNPSGYAGVKGPAGNRTSGGGSGYSLPRSPVPVKGDPGRLLDQAQAAELRALANAAWHRERAGRYLAWHDLPWCAQRYAEHCDAAAFQDAIAARHRSVAAALQGVRP